MSSIYKKGRDGYYYYQTYLTDKETGKKSKKIYHSLGTRSEQEAYKLKGLLDDKYEKLKNDESKTLGFLNFKKYAIKIFFFAICFFSATLFFMQQFSTDRRKIKKDQQVLNNGEKVETNIKNDNEIRTAESLKDQVNPKINNFEIERNSEQPKNIPNYQISRIQTISKAFDQGKIYVNVDDPFDKKGLENICNEIKNKNSNFSNLVICLYNNSEIAKEIAMNDETRYDENIINDVWLALYTYNKVEGTFFYMDPGKK